MRRAGGGVSASILTSLPLAVAPVPEIGFVLQAGAVGTAIGTAVAARARHRHNAADTARIVAAWTLLGLGIGTAVTAIAVLLRVTG